MTNKNKIFPYFISSIVKYFSLITKSLVILTVMSCFFYIYSSVQELKTQEMNQVKIANNLIYRTIYSNISYARYQLFYVAKQLSQTGGDKQKINQILSNYKTNVNNDFDVVTTWNMFSWIDDKGKLTVDGFDGILNKPIDMNHRVYLPITKQDPGKIIFDKALVGAITRRLIVPIAIGVVNDEGKYLGSIVFGIDIEKLTAKLENSVKDDLSQFLIVDHNKKTILKSSSLSIDEEKLVVDKINLNQDFKDGKIDNLGDNLFVQIDKMTELTGDNNVFYLLTINDRKLFERKLSDLIIKKLFTCLMIALFISLLLAKLYYKIVRPIKILSEYANNIAKHKHSTILFEDLDSKEFNSLYKALSSIESHFEIETSLRCQLDTANKAKTTLLKSISHDLRNYISGISGLAEIIVEDVSNKKPDQPSEELQASEGQIIDLARLIIKQSDRMLGFTKDILDTDITELGVIKIDDEEDCDVKELIEEMLILNQHFVKDQQVKITTNFQENLPNLRCDRRRFRQVIDNLITNAVKYSKKGGEVKIACQFLNKEICIVIEDNGIGMSKEDLKALLEGKGKDLDKSDLDKPIDSHGIGMQIVIQLIEVLGAKMEIESEKRKGTIVKLWFGVDKDFQPYAPKIKKETKDKKISLKTILIADDEEVNLMILERVLIGTKHRIIKAKNGEEILKILDKERCDLIFMDIKMPKLDGIEVAKTIRSGKKLKNKKHQSIPLIAISANDDVKSKKKASLAGIDNFIGKPFIKKEIVDLVNKILG
jgi:signal transduction histidine kinase